MRPLSDRSRVNHVELVHLLAKKVRLHLGLSVSWNVSICICQEAEVLSMRLSMVCSS